jgi:hypothetical protein
MPIPSSPLLPFDYDTKNKIGNEIFLRSILVQSCFVLFLLLSNPADGFERRSVALFYLLTSHLLSFLTYSTLDLAKSHRHVPNTDQSTSEPYKQKTSQYKSKRHKNT